MIILLFLLIGTSWVLAPTSQYHLFNPVARAYRMKLAMGIVSFYYPWLYLQKPIPDTPITPKHSAAHNEISTRHYSNILISYLD